MTAESSPSNEEIRKCLKDAGVFEENMSNDDMLAYYKAIKCSQNTAQEEEEHRTGVEIKSDRKQDGENKSDDTVVDFNLDDDIVESPETSIKSPKFKEKLQTPRCSKSKLSLDKSTPLKKVEEYNALDCPPLKHKPLDIISHKREYSLPPYCDPQYSKLSTLERAKIISDFHRGILERFYKHHCESINPCPWGKPIPASEKYQGSLDSKSQSSDNLEFVNVTNEIETTESEQIYTSRSGRQTKRKIYTDNFEDDGDLKKSKKEEDKAFEVEKKVVTKRPNLNKLSNQDIMKRSKLFSDSPEKLTRTEKLFDLLKTNDDKNRSVRKMEDVDDKSKEVDENDSDIIKSSQEEDDDFVLKSKGLDSTGKRGPQSLRGRRGIGGRRLQYLDEKKSNSSSQNSVSSAKSTSSISEPSTSNEQSEKPSQDKPICPICNKVFSQDEIDMHAWSCGSLAETESNFAVFSSGPNVRKEICSVCDKEFVRNTDYEVHVRECIRKYNK